MKKKNNKFKLVALLVFGISIGFALISAGFAIVAGGHISYFSDVNFDVEFTKVVQGYSSTIDVDGTYEIVNPHKVSLTPILNINDKAAYNIRIENNTDDKVILEGIINAYVNGKAVTKNMILVENQFLNDGLQIDWILDAHDYYTFEVAFDYSQYSMNVENLEENVQGKFQAEIDFAFKEYDENEDNGKEKLYHKPFTTYSVGYIGYDVRSNYVDESYAKLAYTDETATILAKTSLGRPYKNWKDYDQGIKGKNALVQRKLYGGYYEAEEKTRVTDLDNVDLNENKEAFLGNHLLEEYREYLELVGQHDLEDVRLMTVEEAEMILEEVRNKGASNAFSILHIGEAPILLSTVENGKAKVLTANGIEEIDKDTQISIIPVIQFNTKYLEVTPT